MTCRSGRHPPPIARLPCMTPLSCARGANPTRAAACSPENWPGSGISALSIVLATGPIPGTERKLLAIAASSPSESHGLLDPGLKLCDLAIRQALQLGIHGLRHIGRPQFARRLDPLADRVLQGNVARRCARSRLRVSANWPRFDGNTLKKRIFSRGRLGPAAGRKAMDGAMSSASIRSVFARMPRQPAQALRPCLAGNDCPANRGCHLRR